MGNANGREDGGGGGGGGGGSIPGGDGSSNSPGSMRANHVPSNSPFSYPDLMANDAPQVPAAPLQPNHMGQVAPVDEIENPPEPSIPTLITWSHGGNSVLVEGSWDNWRSRKKMQRSGKDHSILLVLPSGVYHYKFDVDGEVKYIPELPHEADDTGRVFNLLDVSDYVPENPASVAEFEAPPSPDSSYGQTFMEEDDFAKEPMAAPPHVHLTVHGMENSNGARTSSSKPQHTLLNHLFIDKGWASQSAVALGTTQRFRSKYVSTVIYKPLKR